MNEETRQKKIEDITNKFLTAISEYVDSLQIVLSYEDEGLTTMLDKGFGNFYSRVGMCRSFLTRDQARDSLEVEYSEYSEDD